MVDKDEVGTKSALAASHDVQVLLLPVCVAAFAR